MKYSVVFQDGEQVIEVHSEVEAGDPREALDKVECEGLDSSWQYQDEADGSGTYVDPQGAGRSFQARPMSHECPYCGATVPSEDIGVVPASDDEGEWGRLAFYHFPGCEWIETRGTPAAV